MAFLLNGSGPIVCPRGEKMYLTPISYDTQNKLWMDCKFKCERLYNKAFRGSHKGMPLRPWYNQKKKKNRTKKTLTIKEKKINRAPLSLRTYVY